MKALAVYLLLFLLALSLNAQENGYYGLQGVYAFTGDTYHPAGGISMEGMFGKRLSVTFSVLYGPIDADQYYFYTGGGQALGVYLIKKGFENTSDLVYALPLGLISFVIPESIAYRIPIADSSQLAIYLAPFSYEVIRNTAAETSVEQTSYELGLRYYFEANHWIYIVPRIGMKGFYGERALGANYGLSVLLKAKKKQSE
ncbi:MAG: hypothetical protein ACR2MM_11115 [Flavobacteriaceae bacterium]